MSKSFHRQLETEKCKKNSKTDQVAQEYIYDGELKMEETESEKYLGDIITSNAKKIINWHLSKDHV